MKKNNKKTIKDIIKILREVDFENQDIEQLKELFKILNIKKEQLVNSIIRVYFVKFVGKNIVIKYHNGSEICVICRGVNFYIYDITSTHVSPLKLTYEDMRKMFLDSREIFGDVDKFEVLSDKEAIEYIRKIYVDRAEKSKELLRNLLNYEGGDEGNEKDERDERDESGEEEMGEEE